MAIRLRNLLILVASFAAPALLVLAWHRTNQSLPRSDEGDYFLHARILYERLGALGFFSKLAELYSFRLWKPIALPALMLPAAAAFPHNTLLAVMLWGTVGILLTAFLVFKICRKSLDVPAASLVACFVTMQPWLYNSALGTNAELPFIVVSLLFYKCWLDSEALAPARPRQSLLAGVALVLAFTIRPLETGLLFALPVVYRSIRAARSREVSLRGFLLLMTTPAFGLAVLAFVTYKLPEYHRNGAPGWLSWVFALGIVGLGAATVAWFRKKEKSMSLGVFYVATATGFALWYAPTLGDLIFWINEGSFSSWIKITGGGANHSYAYILFSSLRALFYHPMDVAAVLLVVFAAVSRGGTLPPAAFPALAGCVVPILVGATSYNIAPRYYFACTALAITLVTTAGLSSAFRGVRVAATVTALAAIVVQGLLNYSIVSGNMWLSERFVDLRSGFSQIRRPQRSEDISNKIVLAFSGDLPEEATKARDIGLAQLYFSDVYINYIDRWCLGLAARDNGKKWRFEGANIWWDTSSPTTDFIISEFRRQFEYVLVGPLEGHALQTDHDSLFAAMAVRAASEHKLESKFGFKIAARHQLRESDGSTREFLLLKRIAP